MLGDLVMTCRAADNFLRAGTVLSISDKACRRLSASAEPAVTAAREEASPLSPLVTEREQTKWQEQEWQKDHMARREDKHKGCDPESYCQQSHR
jgi:hypothetical protein